jgi:hypothetical protein
MAQIYANGSPVASNKSILEVVVPKMSTGAFISMTTSASGTPYVSFASQLCSQLTISNDSGSSLDVLQNSTGVAFKIIPLTYFTLYGLQNANTISIRRSDTSSTQLTVTARWEI